MKRSKAVWLSVGFLATAATLAACAQEEGPSYDELCVDRVTMEVVDDDVCEDGHHHGSHGFVYVPYTAGVNQPKYPVGSKVPPGSSFNKPSTGVFLRGGFGGYRGGSSGG